MTWEYRPDVDPQEQLREIGNILGIQNLKDVALEEDGGNQYLVIYTSTKKYRTQLTEV